MRVGFRVRDRKKTAVVLFLVRKGVFRVLQGLKACFDMVFAVCQVLQGFRGVCRCFDEGPAAPSCIPVEIVFRG